MLAAFEKSEASSALETVGQVTCKGLMTGKLAALTGSPSPLSSLGRSSCERADAPRANVCRRNSFGVLYRAALFNASEQSPSPLFHDTQ